MNEYNFRLSRVFGGPLLYYTLQKYALNTLIKIIKNVGKIYIFITNIWMLLYFFFIQRRISLLKNQNTGCFCTFVHQLIVLYKWTD